MTAEIERRLEAAGVRVVDLEWVQEEHYSPRQTGHRASGNGIFYTIISSVSSEQCVLSSHGFKNIGPSNFDFLGDAKAAAEAHHRAAVLAQLGVME